MSSAATSLDRALLGANHSETFRIDSLDMSVVVRVLTPTEILALQITAEEIKERSGEERERVTRSRLLHAACSMVDGSPAFESTDDVMQTEATTIHELWRAYEHMHTRTYSHGVRMVDDMNKRADSDEGAIERLRAHHAVGIVAFYGLRSAMDATTAQVFWFARLMKVET